MNKKTFEQLMQKLDNIESQIYKGSHPSSLAQRGLKSPVGLIITEDTKIESIGKEQLALVHCMLHMFYSGHGGRELTPASIEKLHKKTVEQLSSHEKFDKLDEK